MFKFIDSQLPLPKHTHYKYEECLAKVIFDQVFHQSFDTVDKPDLQNEKLSIGVEVTSLELEEERKLDSLYNNYIYGSKNKKSLVLYQIHKLGGFLQNEILIHPSRKFNFKRFENIIREKLKKINNGGYKLFNTNCLFVIDNIISVSDNSILLKKF